MSDAGNIATRRPAIARLGIDQHKMAQLYARHGPDAAYLAYMMTGDRNLAEDLAQEAFVRLLGRFHDIRNPEALDAYLRRTVVNLSRSHFRKKGRERLHFGRLVAASRANVEEQPDIATRDYLWNAIQRLPYRQRAAVVLRYYADQSERQTADALQTSVKAVKSLITRALNTLRKELQGAER